MKTLRQLLFELFAGAQPVKTAPTHWGGVVPPSVALRNWPSTNKPQRHDEAKACARRLRQMKNGQHQGADSARKITHRGKAA